MLRNGDWNFISIDWGELARGQNYHAVKRNVDLVGNVTARLVHYFLISQQAADTSSSSIAAVTLMRDFHLVGFSLGAHVVGSAGASVKIARITGVIEYRSIIIHIKFKYY
jgi:hypothetical protein